MRAYKIEGIIIKRKNIGEADRILTVFTKKLGKIQVKATGVRKINSRRASHVELLNYAVLTLYKGKSNLPFLTEVSSIKNFSLIKDNLKKVGISYHMCELIDRLCPDNQENESIFSLFLESIQNLCKEDDDPQKFIQSFESRLLTRLGFYSPKMQYAQDNTLFIEKVLEGKLKTRQILPHFL